MASRNEFRLVCLVHPEDEAVREHLMKFCQEKLPLYEQLKAIVFLVALPKLDSGKIDLRTLQQAS